MEAYPLEYILPIDIGFGGRRALLTIARRRIRGIECGTKAGIVGQESDGSGDQVAEMALRSRVPMTSAGT